MAVNDLEVLSLFIGSCCGDPWRRPYLQGCSLISLRRPLCIPSHNCHQECHHQACRMSQSSPPHPHPRLDPAHRPPTPFLLFHGSQQCLGVPTFPHLRLHFPTPGQCLRASLQPSTCPGRVWDKGSQTPQVLLPQAAVPCGRADTGPQPYWILSKKNPPPA